MSGKVRVGGSIVSARGRGGVHGTLRLFTLLGVLWALGVITGCRDGGGSNGPAGPDPETGSAGNPGTTVSGEVEGESYELYVPSNYDPAVPAPVWIIMHGTGGSGGSIIGAFRNVADAEGILLLAPTYFENDTYFPSPWGADTQGLVLQMLDEVEAAYEVDGRRRYLAGFSTGGSWSYVFGLSETTWFAGAAVFAGGYTGPDPATAAFMVSVASWPIPFYLSHGDNDGTFPVVHAQVAANALDAAGHPVLLDVHAAGHAMPPGGAAAAWSFLDGSTGTGGTP